MNGTILVVDDSPANLMLACDVLALDGFHVLHAEHAEAALVVIGRSKPDLILMDISMPGMDGLTLTRKLKADELTRDIVIIALTASAMKGDEQRVASAGCDGYITKPIDTRTFATQVGAYLGARRPHGHKRILVVDDNATNRKLLRAILDAPGVVVLEAADGIEALAMLEHKDVDVIISDILMPRMDGYRLCFEVRKSERLKSVPFIIYTSTYTSPGDKKLALDMGADRYITKPASAQTILDAIRDLESRRGPAPVPSIDLQQEVVLIKEYSQQLVAKLEERNVELTRMTADLRQAHEKLQQLLAHSPAVIYGLRVEGADVVPYLVSENIKDLLGFTEQETLDMDWWVGQVHPDDRQRAVESLSATLSSSITRIEYRIAHKNGEYHWVEDNRRLVRDAANRPQEIAGVWTDITERKLLEAKVALRELQLGAFFSNSTAGLCIIDLDNRYVQINDTLARMNGASVEAHIGQTVRAVIPDLAQTLEPILRRVQATKEPVLNAEITGTTTAASGTTRHWIASYFPLMDEAGIVTGIGSVVVEVTERKSAEQALRLSEGRFRQLTDHIPEVFWMSTPDLSEILYVSPAYETIWGRSVQALYRDPREWLDAVVPEDLPKVLESFRKLGTGAAQVKTEYRVRHPDGSLHWILDRGFPVHDEDGNVHRLTGIAKDITEQKTLEEGLRRAQKMEAIGQLAGGIAHDFNNILGSIVGYTELAILDTVGNSAARADLDEVLKSSLRAKELVRQILAFSRQEEHERKSIDLETVVEEALKLLRASLPSTIEIRAELPEAPVPVLADANQVHQIMMNLATNAAHAMNGSGRLTVALTEVEIGEDFVRVQPELHAGRHAKLTITDTGCGMDSDTLQRVFEPFFTTKAPGEGTGLGLSVVHGIVKGHEGAITVQSEPGRGTSFDVYFPIRAPSAPESQANSGSDRESAPDGECGHVLLVDDERALALMEKRILERAGYRVTMHTSAAEALADFRDRPRAFDLIITDLTMPGMNGIDLAAELSKLRPDLPIILATGFSGSMTAVSMKALGFRDVLMKPTTRGALLASVQHSLESTRGN